MTSEKTLHDLKTLVASFHPAIAMETVEEERVGALLSDLSVSLQMPLFEWSITRGLSRTDSPAPIHGTNEPAVLLQHLNSLSIEAIFLLKDFCLHLDNPSTRRYFRELLQSFSGKRSTVVLTGADLRLPDDVDHSVAHFRLRLPSLDELKQHFRYVLESIRKQTHFDIDLDPEHLEELMNAFRGMTLKQVRQALTYVIMEDGRLSAEDIPKVAERKIRIIADSGLLEYQPLGTHSYRLGGFDRLKQWLERSRTGFSARARAWNLTPPRGILLVGVQGCGKSLAAKFIAQEWKLPLLKLDSGRLFNKFIGETERNFRKAVRLAEAAAPIVLWIDEIEKGLASNGGSDTDGGVSRRLLGSFLTWLQEKKDDIFIVATANDLSQLPSELLRKGRFDEIFFVDLPSSEERIEIWRIHLRLRNQTVGGFDLDSLVAATEGFSGAEIEQVVIAAAYRALHEQAPLTTPILLETIGETVPLSVTRREQLERLRIFARDRFVPVS